MFHVNSDFHCPRWVIMASVLLFNALSGSSTRADEGGTSFWLPGQYGSFAAVAPEPGASLAMVSYWYSANASASEPLGFGNDLKLGVDASYFGQFVVPAYTPDTTILGGRPSFSLAFIPARSKVSADISIGGVSAAASDEVTGMSDLYPTAQLFWNRGLLLLSLLLAFPPPSNSNVPHPHRARPGAQTTTAPKHTRRRDTHACPVARAARPAPPSHRATLAPRPGHARPGSRHGLAHGCSLTICLTSFPNERLGSGVSILTSSPHPPLLSRHPLSAPLRGGHALDPALAQKCTTGWPMSRAAFR